MRLLESVTATVASTVTIAVLRSHSPSGASCQTLRYFSKVSVSGMSRLSKTSPRGFSEALISQMNG